MNRHDWYLFALGTLQIILLFHIISMMQTGPVVSLTGQANVDGYLVLFLLILSVFAPLKNLSRIIISATRDNEKAKAPDITSIGQWTLAGITAIIALEFLQSLALLNTYSAGY